MPGHMGAYGNIWGLYAPRGRALPCDRKRIENLCLTMWRGKWATTAKEILYVNGGPRKSLPDVLCLEEHSLGLAPEVLKRFGLEDCADKELLSHEKIVAALIPEGFEFCVQGTGEKMAKFSELANMVVWRTAKFQRVSRSTVQGTQITPQQKPLPTKRGFYTPRSVACVELRPAGGGQSFIVCATHLLGGRFEDSQWAEDNEAGTNGA